MNPYLLVAVGGALGSVARYGTGVLVGNALSDSVADAVLFDRTRRLRALFERAVEDERLFAIGVCSAQGRLLEKTDRFPAALDCTRADQIAGETTPQLSLESGSVHVAVRDVLEGMRAAIDAIAEGRLNPGPLYTHRFRLDQIAAALDLLRDRPAGFMKALMIHE